MNQPTYTFRPAVREQTSMLLGLAGPSSSGKTFSALRLATGMAGGDKIMMIDTEGRRGLHYADQFKFEHCNLTAPFRPQRYMEALIAAKALSPSVIIVDSQSHSHEGPGGLLEYHEEELTRMGGQDHAKRERVKFAAWIKPKQEQNLFVNSVLQLDINVIFCFRAKKKLMLVKNQKGKIEPVDIGWQPICSDRFEFEMTALLMLPPNSQGIPELTHESTKLQEQHKGLIKPGQQLTEDTGRALAEWARGAPPRPTQAAASESKTPVAGAFTIALWDGTTRSFDEPMDWLTAMRKCFATISVLARVENFMANNIENIAAVRGGHPDVAQTVAIAFDDRLKELTP